MKESRDHSDRLTFEFDAVKVGQYSKITSSVVSHFDLQIASEKVKGTDEIFQDFKKEKVVLGLEWDAWSGFIISAKTVSAEPLVREIASYVDSEFNS